MSRAAEIIGDQTRPVPLVVTCEHATNSVPPPLTAEETDRPWLGSHWGWDIGAADVARELVRLTESVGVLSRFSRLVCDANRPCDHPEWIRTEVEGHALSFNQGLDATERQRRRAEFHEPYHRAVDRVLSRRALLGGDILLLPIHSFTPVLGDEVRQMEVGVLYSEYEAVAHRLAELLEQQGFKTALNQPYSGLSGLVYAAHYHGRNHDVVYQELELRQDLLGSPEESRAVAGRLAAALSQLKVRKERR